MLTIFKILICTYVVIDFVSELSMPYFDAINKKINNKLLKFLIGKLFCWKCVSFWSTLLITLSFTDACIAVFFTYIVSYLMKKMTWE